MSHRWLFPVSLLAGLLIAAGFSTLHAQSRQSQPVPTHASYPSPAVTDDFVHKQFGENCSLLAGPSQFVADIDGDGVDDLVLAARCKNPMADQAEYGFRVIDPYNTFLGFGDVKVTSTFASDAPERRGVSLLVIHGAGPDAWRSETPKAKFLMINLPFKTLAVKKLALKKKTVLGVYMEERGEGEDTSSVVFWDGKKKRYRYQMLGSSLE
jgi:hypothetical protein